jgi:hypothetical protein
VTFLFQLRKTYFTLNYHERPEIVVSLCYYRTAPSIVCLLFYFSSFKVVPRVLDMKLSYRPTVTRVIFQSPLYKRIAFVDFVRENLLIFESLVFLNYSLENPVTEREMRDYITYLLVFAKYKNIRGYEDTRNT